MASENYQDQTSTRRMEEGGSSMTITDGNPDEINASSTNHSKIILFILLVLSWLVPGPGIVAADLAEHLGISKPNLTISLSAFSIPYVLMIYCSLPKNKSFRKHVPRSTSQGAYNELRRKDETIFHQIGKALYSRELARAGLLISWWAACNVSIPRLRRLTLLGSPLWRWSLLGFTVTAAYFGSLFLCVILSLFIALKDTKLVLKRLPLVTHRKIFPCPVGTIQNTYLCYGLFPSASHTLYFSMVLGAWAGYFSTESGIKHESVPHPVAFKYVTWTLISLLAGSVLRFLKTLLLLRWSAKAIYRRLERRMLIAGVEFLYLGLIFGGFLESRILRKMALLEELTLALQPESMKEYIFTRSVDISYLHKVGQLLTSLAEIAGPKESGELPDLMDSLYAKIKHPDSGIDVTRFEPDGLKKLLVICSGDLSDQNLLREQQKRKYGRLLFPLISRIVQKPNISSNPPKDQYPSDIAKVLHCLVRENSETEDKKITFDDFKKWTVESHMNCMNMGRTLANASAILTYLNKFMSCIIFVLVALLWLLITGIATTKVIVTVAAPLLGLTYIFGDSAKLFFQGAVFCFGIHAFDVGDRCILDDTELVVRRIGILTTTFTRVGFGADETRMYPNSVLATKAIVNLGSKPDASDTVELTFDLSTKTTDWTTLEEKILLFFNKPEQRKIFWTSHKVTMKEDGDKIKLTIHFKHVLSVDELTHHHCFEKKNEQRSIILKEISHFLDPKAPT